jgi:hypothetical protein
MMERDDSLYATTVYVHYGRGGSLDGVSFYGWWAELEWRQLMLESDEGACSGWITKFSTAVGTFIRPV